MSLIKHTTWLLLALSLTAATTLAQDAQQKDGQQTQGQTQQESSGTAKPFQLGVEQKDFLPPPQPPPPNYGPPMMMGQPNYAPAPVQQPLNTGIQQQAPPPQQGVLPPQFLGRWQVMGNRAKVEAMPQFQAGIDNIFSMRTQNVWTIQGNPKQGYTLNNDQGVSTGLMVQATMDTAFLRYQHQIKNTMAQEAVVMQLQPGGATFQGIERISIVKQGEGVRAKVEYNLLGRRQ
jgi:hypothetical protein